MGGYSFGCILSRYSFKATPLLSFCQFLKGGKGWEMGALTGRQIKALVEAGHLVIDPFDQQLIEPASYDLRLGSKILASPLGPDELGRVIELNQNVPEYKIQTGQMVAVMSRERMEFPLDLCSNSFGIRSEFVRKGLHCFGGPHLDPGGKVV